MSGREGNREQAQHELQPQHQRDRDIPFAAVEPDARIAEPSQSRMTSPTMATGRQCRRPPWQELMRARRQRPVGRPSRRQKPCEVTEDDYNHAVVEEIRSRAATAACAALR